MIHGGRIQEYMEKTGLERTNILDFSANINPLGPPSGLREFLLGEFSSVKDYPDPAHTHAKVVLSLHYKLPIQNLICGNGAAEIIDLFFQRIRPHTTYVLQPAFAEYELSAERYGLQVVSLSLDVHQEFALPDLQGLKQLQAGDAVVLNNPHNPTGRLYTRKEMQHLINWVIERDAYLLLDESFMDFVEQESEVCWLSEFQTEAPHTSALSSFPYERLLIVRSATKMYAIPGLRFGFGVASAHLIDKLSQFRDGWSVNALAQAAVGYLYEQTDFQKQTHAWLATEHQFIHSTWGNSLARGQAPLIKLYPPAANYAFVRFLTPNFNIEALQEHLSGKGIFVRDCRKFQNLDATYMRFAIRTRAENETLWYAICEYLSQIE